MCSIDAENLLFNGPYNVKLVTSLKSRFGKTSKDDARTNGRFGKTAKHLVYRSESANRADGKRFEADH